MTVPKYKNHRCPGIAPDGSQRTYDSQREAQHAYSLYMRQKAGDIGSWTPQARITLEIAGQPLLPFLGKRDAVYIADFLVTLSDGSIEVHEVKGFIRDKDPVTRLWRLKLALVQAMHPDWRIVLI